MASKKSNSGQEAVNISKAIRMCLDSGKAELGSRTAMQDAKQGKGKLVVIAANAPADEASDLARYCKMSSLPLLTFEGTSLELGSICGKPFPVSALVVLEVGNSPIMQLLKK